jgi:hypothetical protein
MTDILKPGAGIIFMKVGIHAQEPLEEIIARKAKEIDDAGFALWGYGGNTCHPQTMVQPFAASYELRGQKILLCMHEMNSKHRADPVRADELSGDGVTWEKIPDRVNVLGSRYALVIKNLRREEFNLPLNQARVALGKSEGMNGGKYLRGRVDKGCFEMGGEVNGPIAPGEASVKIGLVAELRTPYAVYVRNRG